MGAKEEDGDNNDYSELSGFGDHDENNFSDGDDYVDSIIAQMFENRKRCKLRVNKKNQDAHSEAATCENESWWRLK